MKRLLILFILMLTLCISIVGCGCDSTEEDTYSDDPIQSAITSTIPSQGDISPHNHQYSEWVVITEASCSLEGEEKSYCKICGIGRSRFSARLEHIGGEPVRENEVLPTCQKIGSYDMVTRCVSCSEVMGSERVTLPMTDHTPSKLVLKYEYCGTTQVSDVYCEHCNLYITSYGHKYETSSALPTCKNQGYILNACTLCGKEECTYIDAFGHMEKGWEVEREATCQATGLLVNKCVLCEYVLAEKETGALGHTYVAKIDDDSLVYSCTSCDDNYIEALEGEVFTVDFVTNGADTCQSIAVKEGEVVTLPSPQKEGYCLEGWYYDRDGKTEYFDEPIFENTTLYALWQEKDIVSIKDNSISSAVELDFSFNVINKNGQILSGIEDYISVYDVCDNKVKINVVSKGDGVYEVTSDNYQQGSYYYAVIKEPLCFEDTEQMERQFTTKGENKTSIALDESVLKLDSTQVYGIIEENGQYILLTGAELSSGKNVAIYEGDENNIVCVIKIISRSEKIGLNAYAFEMADYEEAFDEFEINVSTELSFDNFQLNTEAEEEIKAQFMSSPLYNQAVGAAQSLASVENIKLKKEPTIKPSIKIKDGKIVAALLLRFEFDNEFTIEIDITNNIGVSSEVYAKSIEKHAFIATTTIDTNISIEAVYGMDEGFFKEDEVTKVKFKDRKKYKELLEKYKEFFNQKQYDKIGMVDQESDLNKYVRLGQVKLPVSGIAFYFNVGLEADFFFGGVVGIDLNFETAVSFGIRNGNGVRGESFDLKASSLFAKAKIEINPKLVMEIGANACGLCLYANANVGPYFDAGIVGVVNYNGEQIMTPQGSTYFEMGIKYGASVGLKHEISLFGETHRLFDFKISLVDKKKPVRTYGTEKIAVGYADYEEPIEKEHDCESGIEISLDTINTSIVEQDFRTMEFQETKAKSQIAMKSVSGYASQIKIKDNKLIFDNVPEDVTVVLSVKYNELITKEVTIIVKAKHPQDCIHLRCNHTGGKATCTEKAVCEICGVEYGEEPKGHMWQSYICSVCGEYDGSDGLAYVLSEDGTSYFVFGIGTCYSANVVIPTTYNDLPVTGICDRAFYLCSDLTSIVISSNVTSIGAYAFCDCDRLTSVIIANSVTSIGNSAFYGCERLTSITMPNSITGFDASVFGYCESIDYNTYDNTLYLGNEENPYLVLVEAVNTSITSCKIHPNTKIIGENAFDECRNLTSIIIPNGVTSIGDFAFADCEKLTAITIPNGVTNIGYAAFVNCSSLTNLEIPDSIVSVGDRAFRGCKRLSYNNYGNALYFGNKENPYFVLVEATDTSITSCEINESTKVIAQNAFRDCANLSKIKIPNSVISIGVGAFYDCSKLTNITISSGVTSIGYNAFCGSSLNSIVVEEGNQVYKSINGNLYTKDGKTLIQYAICKTDREFVIPEGVTNIGYNAFDGCSNLTNITIPSSVTNIGKNAFSGCSGLINITIPNSVTSIGYNAFYGCSSLTNVTIPSSVISIGYGAFANCINLTSVTIPDSVTSIGYSAFSRCESLTKIVIPNSVKDMSAYVFWDCNRLKIYCEAKSRPSGWNSLWNDSNRPVQWGYKG